MISGRNIDDNCRTEVIVVDVVLIKEENIPRMKWRKGKIIKVIRGNYGKVTGVKLNLYQTKLKKTIVSN